MDIKFNNKNNKKGAVEMSLNLIVMLVIGLTLLGLLISFVTGFLSEAQNSFSGKISEDDKIQLDNVLNEADNFAVNPSSLVVKKGNSKSSKLFMKVRNPTNVDLEFIPTNGEISDSGNLKVEISAGRNGDVTDPAKIPKFYIAPISLKGGEEEAYSIEVSADKDVKIGTYYAKFTLTLDGGETLTKLVTVSVE